ncbi:MAG: VOC family protein, partial [Hyphomicrobiaceae bacterium]
MPTTSGPATAIPATAMRYRDVAAASDWLCSAFGFEKQTVLADDNGAPLYIQLTFGRAMLMLAPVRPSPIDSYMKQPDEIGGAETQSGYYVVPDADAHYARAKAAGAAIVLEIEDDDFGGRTYTCRDPEGHIWTFGTYDPWQGKFPEPALVAEAAAAPPARGRGRRLVRAVLTLAFMGGVGVAGWYAGVLSHSRAISLTAQAPTAAALQKRAALEAAEQA